MVVGTSAEAGGLLNGKVAIITGGASGIGRAGVERMAAEGASVVVADLNAPAARAVADAVQGAGASALPVQVDVRDSAAVQAMVSAALERFGRIDALFHNAVDVPLVNKRDNRITELDEEVWRAITDLVLTGTFLCAKYVARHMLKAGGGSIILTGTVDALIGQAGIDAYTAAKGGVVAMTRSMAAGLAPHGVRVNTICPGFVETPHQAAFLDDPVQRAEIEALQPMGVLAPEDIAEMAVFLASDRARRITGATHVVDAGYTAIKGGMDIKAVVARE